MTLALLNILTFLSWISWGFVVLNVALIFFVLMFTTEYDRIRNNVELTFHFGPLIFAICCSLGITGIESELAAENAQIDTNIEEMEVEFVPPQEPVYILGSEVDLEPVEDPFKGRPREMSAPRRHLEEEHHQPRNK